MNRKPIIIIFILIVCSIDLVTAETPCTWQNKKYTRDSLIKDGKGVKICRYTEVPTWLPYPRPANELPGPDQCDKGSCFYESVEYSPGAILTMQGEQRVCGADNAEPRWYPLSRACSSIGYSTSCLTSLETCKLNEPVPIGSSCICNTDGGINNGIAK